MKRGTSQDRPLKPWIEAIIGVEAPSVSSASGREDTTLGNTAGWRGNVSEN
jgi:hypothetical protein